MTTKGHKNGKVSSLRATILLIAIAAATAIIVYAFVTGLIGGLTVGGNSAEISPQILYPSSNIGYLNENANFTVSVPNNTATSVALSIRVFASGSLANQYNFTISPDQTFTQKVNQKLDSLGQWSVLVLINGHQANSYSFQVFLNIDEATIAANQLANIEAQQNTATNSLLLGVLGVIVTPIAAVLAAVLTVRWTLKGDAKKSHFNDIKIQVLTPMRKQVENHYLPILQFKNTNLSVQRLEERKYDAILSEPPVRYELRVRPWEPGRNSFSGVAEDSVMTIDPHLADHCRLFHFGSLLSEWDSLKASADKFNQECCALTESLTEEIRSSLGLKLMRAWDTPGEYVTPALGLSIYLRMVGLNENPMSAVTQNGQHGQVVSVAFGGQIAAQLKPGTDTAPFQAAVDEAIRRNSAEAEKLRSVARELEQEFERLNGDLKRSLESERLPGNCDYL